MGASSKSSVALALGITRLIKYRVRSAYGHAEIFLVQQNRAMIKPYLSKMSDPEIMWS
jgi:hypothetical protein